MLTSVLLVVAVNPVCGIFPHPLSPKIINGLVTYPSKLPIRPIIASFEGDEDQKKGIVTQMIMRYDDVGS